MISFSIARVVIVASEQAGRSAANALMRMGLGGVSLVANLDLARQLCAAGSADACLVVLPLPIPDELPQWTAESEAPGREAGIPSLLLADMVTPYVTKSARNAGYLAAISAQLPQRLLYRWIGALLQKRQQARPAERNRRDVPRVEAAHALVDEASDADKLQ